MPAIKKVSYTNIFSQLNNASAAAGEHNDCSVKAVALATGCGYSRAKDVLALCGRKDRKGAYTYQITNAIRSLGRATFNMNIGDIVRSYPEPHRSVLKGITTHHPRRFNKHWPKGTFLLFTKGHVACVIDGELHVWTVNKAHRVVAMYKVI